MKHEVADLPPKTEDVQCRQLHLSAHQVNEYTGLVRDVKAVVQQLSAEKGSAQKNVAILAHLHKLRLLCADPPALRGVDRSQMSLSEYRRMSPKIGWLIDTLESIRQKGEKVIVFTEFRDIQRALQQVIADTFQIRVSVVNGDTGVSKGLGDRSRQGIIDAFQKVDGFGVIILSTTAVGFGVNVQAANHVIHYTRPWNPAKEDQASDRAYRIGQERPVTLYYAAGKGHPDRIDRNEF